jgi:hypothetical protein
MDWRGCSEGLEVSVSLLQRGGSTVRWIIDLFRKLKANRDREWRSVPYPNWRCSRGGRDIW